MFFRLFRYSSVEFLVCLHWPFIFSCLMSMSFPPYPMRTSLSSECIHAHVQGQSWSLLFLMPFKISCCTSISFCFFVSSSFRFISASLNQCPLCYCVLFLSHPQSVWIHLYIFLLKVYNTCCLILLLFCSIFFTPKLCSSLCLLDLPLFFVEPFYSLYPPSELLILGR